MQLGGEEEEDVRIVSVLQLQSRSKELEKRVLPQTELKIRTTSSFHSKVK